MIARQKLMGNFRDIKSDFDQPHSITVAFQMCLMVWCWSTLDMVHNTNFMSIRESPGYIITLFVPKINHFNFTL